MGLATTTGSYPTALVIESSLSAIPTTAVSEAVSTVLPNDCQPYCCDPPSSPHPPRRAPRGVTPHVSNPPPVMVHFSNKECSLPPRHAMSSGSAYTAGSY